VARKQLGPFVIEQAFYRGEELKNVHWKNINRSAMLVWGVLGFVGWLLSMFLVKDVIIGDAGIDIGTIGIFPAKSETRPEGRVEFLYARPLESATELLERFRAEYRVPEAKRKLVDMPHVFKLEVRTGDVIRISARGSSPEHVKELLNDLIDKVMDRHAQILEKARRNLDLRRLLLLEAAYELASLGFSELTEGSEGESGKSREIKDSIQELDSILSSIALLDQAKSIVFTRPTEVVLRPTTRNAKTQPKPILYFFTALVVAFVGYIQTIGVILLWEQARRAKVSPEE